MYCPSLLSPSVQIQRRTPYWPEWRFPEWRFRHWLVVAAALHVLITVAIYLVGRAGLIPGTFDANGVGISFAFDSLAYRREVIRLVDVFHRLGFSAWLHTPSWLHLKLYSVPFALLSPLLGGNVLSIEPLNLFYYLTILTLVFKLGCEVFERRAALIGAAAVALWPSFFLYSTQWLRDPPFIIAALSWILISAQWLTRSYSWSQVPLLVGSGTLAVVFVWILKFTTWPILMIVGIFGLVGLALRQWQEKRLLPANMVGFAAMVFITGQIPKWLPISHILSFSSPELPAPAVTSIRPTPPQTSPGGLLSGTPASMPLPSPTSTPSPTPIPAPSLVERINNQRQGFVASYMEAGSNIDLSVRFGSFAEVLGYLPRALQIGLCAPFPNMWFDAAGMAGRAGRILAALEMVMVYAFEAMALLALWRERHRIAMWMLLCFALVGVTALSLLVTNVGALYRMRYVFWIVLFVIGARGCTLLLTNLTARLSSRQHTQNSQTIAQS